jgi:hypothetical protein
MTLTPAQAATLKAAINNTPAWAAYPNNDDGNFDLAVLISKTAVPEFKVWQTAVPTDVVMDQIDGTKYSPTATISGSEVEPLLSRKRGWLDEVNIKQMLLQNLLAFRPTFNASLTNNRAGLRDAVIQLPTGALDGNGKPGLTSAGGSSGVNVLTVCLRDATEIERVLSKGPETTGTVTGDVMGFEGPISASDVAFARNT